MCPCSCCWKRRAHASLRVTRLQSACACSFVYPCEGCAGPSIRSLQLPPPHANSYDSLCVFNCTTLIGAPECTCLYLISNMRALDEAVTGEYIYIYIYIHIYIYIYTYIYTCIHTQHKRVQRWNAAESTDQFFIGKCKETCLHARAHS
jgi:hypothetical protein